MQSVRDGADHPPMENSQGWGWGVLVNVQWGYLGACQFFGGRMTSRGKCPRGYVLVNVFTPPPSGNPVSAPGIKEVTLTKRFML